MLTKSVILKYLKENKKSLQKQYNIKEIALYGSYAKDKQSQTSDIDLLISSDTSVSDIEKFREKLFSHFHTNIDILEERNIFIPTIKLMIKRECIYV
ncbi:MAG: nucleotidyltransferase domain-containing protein [Campylobacterota bacterium]|nr:nucleotidyltransferase domain-containing protein [Campylobacterota bacterium]